VKYYSYIVYNKETKGKDFRKSTQQMGTQNNNTEAAQIIADAMYDLGEMIKETSPNTYSSMSGNSLTDCMWQIGFELGRIADVMEKQSKQK
jgi:quinolinate synthase